MASCHKLFSVFNKNVSRTDGKKDKMLNSKNGLRERIRKYFKENHPGYHPKFYIQGSYKMKTCIRTKDDICDLDDGIYFFREPDVSSTTLQTWVKDAVDGYTRLPPEHRKKCIRNVFFHDYEIDMPIYYKIDGQEYKLAIKNNGWEDSDPKAMVDWFNKRKDPNGHLLRLTKYQKSWCDNIRNRMPSGLVMTILTTNAKEKFYYNERDDISLRDTLKEIKKTLDHKFECVVPITPNDDLFVDYDNARKNKFLKALNEFIEDADGALREKNQLRASRLWQKHLGDRFPDGEDKDEDEISKTSLFIGSKTSNPWGK